MYLPRQRHPRVRPGRVHLTWLHHLRLFGRTLLRDGRGGQLVLPGQHRLRRALWWLGAGPDDDAELLLRPAETVSIRGYRDRGSGHNEGRGVELGPALSVRRGDVSERRLEHSAADPVLADVDPRARFSLAPDHR